MLVVIASQEELKLVHELGYSNNPVLITGVGGINVIQSLKDLPKDTPILNIGYAGSNCLKVGTTVEVSKVHTNHDNAHFVETDLYLKPFSDSTFPSYPCYTNTDFVTHTEKFEPCVFDMELAFIRAMFDNVYSIKVVSDNLSINQYRDVIKQTV